MYFIVNYVTWEKYPKSFTDFNTAFMVYELQRDINKDTIIEYVDEDGRSEVVWSKKFEEVELHNEWNERKCDCRIQ